MTTGQRMAALEAALLEPDPSSLGAGERLRRSFAPDDVAWALTQASLRRKAATRYSRSAGMLFTPAGLEQGSREPVARWRARRFLEAGVEEVWDLGCGIGADAMAFREAGLRVVGVEVDAETAAVARHNLGLVGGGEVIVGRAEDARVPAGAAVFLDPARRTARGRTWRVEDFTPPWEFVLGQLAGERFCCVKLGPGVPKELLPEGVQTTFVSHRGDVVEASLWNRLPEGMRAVLLSSLDTPREDRIASADSQAAREALGTRGSAGAPREGLGTQGSAGSPREALGTRGSAGSPREGLGTRGSVESRVPRGVPGASTLELSPRGESRGDLEVRPVGRYVLEPDGAVIRAGLLDAIAPEHDLWLLDPHIAYLSSDEPLDTPFATSFEVLEHLPYEVRAMRAWVRDNAVGTLEIKKRGIDVDPAALRRQLKPKGPNSATLLLARTVEGTRTLVCRRSP